MIYYSGAFNDLNYQFVLKIDNVLQENSGKDGWNF
ncbi:hypothetical protein SAMN05443550_102436 [Pedobacter hartonius]|uniref:Uncharacterized protein n=1 Tax=Pedobacter hartonius TaxID=425514 RepID=A0A1H3ZNX3_9SPHI|nr:hypothetical protein SAMN05443550_102436 [Pedobacter hartonius]